MSTMDPMVDDATKTVTPEVALVLSLIDQAIRDISGRNLVPTGEMSDLLLDIRQGVSAIPVA